jgi:PQQ-dependent dehydrogenase (s-GDH family)
MSPITTARTGTLVTIFTIVSKILLAQSDDCATPTSLTPGATCINTSGTLFNATSSGIAGSCAGTKYDVWYTFTTPSGCTSVSIDVADIPAGGSNIDGTNTFIEAFSGANCSTTTVGTCTAMGTTLTLNGLTPSTNYHLRVYTTTNPTAGNAAKWDYNICITYTPPPANDDCSGAITLTSATSCSNTSGSIVNATATTGLPAGCETGSTHYDVWYKFVAANTTETATISGQGASFGNPQIQLYSGSCGSLSSLNCGSTSVSWSALTIGLTYYVRVSNVGSSPSGNGGFSICVTHPTPPVLVVAGRMNEVYKQTVLSGSGVLQYPWEIAYGPDNYLWITESRGYKVYRMNPNTGIKTTVLDISQGSTSLSAWGADSLTVQFPASQNPWPQGGLAGLALHPNFLDGTGTHDYVYVSYVHRFLGGVSPTGQFFRNKLVRFTYNSLTDKLESPVVLCDTLPGGSDHNSQRILIAPVGGTNYLFYASGDMGAGQFANRTRPNNAQNPASYEGKILRFNLEQVAGSWIPTDNPYSATSAVYAIGIRNNQGFAYDPTTNTLYGASHGPYSDDEINIIESHRNYGHPLIEGFVDGNYNGNSVQGTITSISAGAPWTDNSGVSSCPPIGNEATNKATIDANGNGLYKDPLFSAYAASAATVTNIWQTNPGNANPAPGWPTEAWSGLDLYNNKVVPGWKNSLIAASLKWGRLVRLRLNGTGAATAPTNSVSDTVTYFNSQNRFRDLAFSPDGKDIFVIMDNSSTTSGPGAANPVVPTCAGCVQKYTFLGYYDVSGKSSIPTSIDVTDGTVNNCNTGTTITIDNTNSTLWVPITGPDGNIMAEIYANGNNLGTVTSSFYKNSGAIRIANTTHYLDRNLTITPQTQPSSTVKIRLYISKAELDALIADGASGVTSISNLQILKNSDVCSNALTNTTTLITPTFAEAFGANGYMLQGDITSFSSFYFASTNATLPLDLLTFAGRLQNDNSVLLNWKTENEINASHFIVERSIDGNRFNGIGNVSANGRNNTGGSSNYDFTDNDAIKQSSQKIYYRLRMVDIDGTYKFSNIVSVAMPFITGKMIISPNPVIDLAKVMLASPENGKVQWKLIDNIGRIILKGTEHVNKGVNNFSINMNRLPAGTYYLNVTGAGNDQRVKMQKL